MSLMSKNTAAYVAGFIDADGYIALIPRKSGKDGISYRPVVKATQASKRKSIIFWLKESFGGYISKGKGNGNQLDYYEWDLVDKNVEPFLKKITPYLKLKKKQAKLVLKKIRLEDRVVNKGANKGLVYPEEVKEEIDNCYKRIRELNKRGKT